MKNEVVVDVWGNFACFTQPHAKVERVSYDVPTPSACRGILNSIYEKPKEFYYQITKIEVMNPIRMINIKKNEVNCKAKGKVEDQLEKVIQEIGLLEDDIESAKSSGDTKTVANCQKSLKKKDKKRQELVEKILNTDYSFNASSTNVRTQRNNYYLRHVYYRIHAEMILQPGCEERVTEASIMAQFYQRVKNGKCFYQPYLGTRECMCFFAEADPERTPINEDRDLGFMLYDNFDIRSNIPLDTNKNTGKIVRSFYHPVMKKGVISVPSFLSRDVLKPE